MGIRRHVIFQGPENVDLSRGVVDVVIPTHDMGDTHIRIVHHHGQVVGGGTVGTGNDQIVQFPVADHYPALDEIVDDHVAVQGVFEPHHRRIALRGLPSEVPVFPVIPGFLAPAHGLPAHGFQFFPAAITIVRQVPLQQFLYHRFIFFRALRLVDNAFVIRTGHIGAVMLQS